MTCSVTVFKEKIDEFVAKNWRVKQVGNYYVYGRSQQLVRLPNDISPQLGRLLGIIYGDGSFSHRRLTITDRELIFHTSVLRKMFGDLFNVTPNIFHDEKRNTYYSHTKSKLLLNYFEKIMGVPTGQLRNAVIPNWCDTVDISFRRAMVGGLFDAESHVRARQAEIDFTTTSSHIFNFCEKILSFTNISFSVRERARRKHIEYEINIYGKDDLIQFVSLIGFSHPTKIVQISRVWSH